jgi:hypothetical protein
MSDRRRLGLQVSQGAEDFDELLAALTSRPNDTDTAESPDSGATIMRTPNNNVECQHPDSLPPAHSMTSVYDAESLRRKIRAGHVLKASEIMHLEAVLQQEYSHRQTQSASPAPASATPSPLQPPEAGLHPRDAFTRLSQQKNPHSPSMHSRSRHARSPGPAYYQPEIWTGPPITRSRNKYGTSDAPRSSIPASSSADAVVDGSPLSAHVRADNVRLQARLSNAAAATDCLMDTELAALRRGEMASESRARKAREAATLAARNETLRLRLREICTATGESPALRLHRMQTRRVGGRTRSPARELKSLAVSQHVCAPRGTSSHEHAPRSARSARSACRSSEPSVLERSSGAGGEHDAWLRSNPDARQRLQAYAKEHAPK